MMRVKLEKTRILRAFCLVLLGCLAVACYHEEPVVETQVEHLVLDRPARVPAGVVRYCWEEPMVNLDARGPGLDPEGKWYRPAHTAATEVRMGRWRPCRPVPSEASGDSGK